MPLPSARANDIPISGIREMAALAAATPDVLRLEIGDPDAMTPAHVTEAAFRWASANRVSYPPNAGIPDLRAAIADKVTRINRLPCEVGHVNVTVGGTGAIYLALLATIEPGDEVLVPDPGWAGYPAMVALAGGRLVPYRLDRSRGFALDPAALRAAITQRSRAILVNSPGNPTGGVFGRDALQDVLDIAREHDLWIIADDCYDQILMSGSHVSIGALEPVAETRVLSAFSFSKTYAMTGWRIGYLIAPPEISAHVTRMQSAAVSSTSAVAQMAALAALRGDDSHLTGMLGNLRRRRDAVCAQLTAGGVPVVVPDGAMFAFADISASGMTSRDFAMGLLRERAVCTTPGDAFGAGGEGFVRLSLACPDETLTEGVSRLLAFAGQRG